MELIVINNKKYYVWHARIKEVIPTDSKNNPYLWFAKTEIDMVVCGYKRKRDVLEVLKQDIIVD